MATDGMNPEIRMDEVLAADDLPPEPPLLEVLPTPRPPHPNLGWSLLWCLGILATLYGTIFAAIFVIVIGQAISSRIRGEKTDQEEPHDRALAPGNERSPDETRETRKVEEAKAKARMARLQQDVTESLPFSIFLGEVV